MTTTKTIAALAGPTFVVGALSVLLNLSAWPSIAEQAFGDAPLIYLSGYFLFVAGLAIVNAHNRWTPGWELLVTLVGWLTLLAGITRILFPARLLHIVVAAVHSGALPVIAVAFLLVGVVLCIKGYGGE